MIVLKNGLKPLSYGQERIWFLQQLYPGNPFYNSPYAIKFTGALRTDILKHALRYIVYRHEILRACFPAEKGIPYLAIMPHRDVDVPLIDVSRLEESQHRQALEAHMLDAALKPFDLSGGPLFRFVLVRLSLTEHVLIMVFHHGIFDAWSAGILLKELLLLYEAGLKGSQALLPELPWQYPDYAARQRVSIEPALMSDLCYWKAHLGDNTPVLQLPFDHPRPKLTRHAGSIYDFTISPDLTRGIKALCRKERVTLFMFLLTAFKVLLYRYTGQEELIVGCPVAGRTQPAAENLIGLFVNTLPVKTRVEARRSFGEILHQVRNVVLEAFNHQELPFDKLVAELSPARQVNINPLFQVIFNMHNMPQCETILSGLAAERLEYDYKTSLIDLCLKVRERQEAIQCTLSYDTELFEAPTIQRMAGHFLSLVAGIIANPGQSVSRLPLLTEPEKRLLLEDWSHSGPAGHASKCIQQLFEEQVDLNPDRIALLYGGQTMTYRQLNNQANRLAHYLQGLGVGPEVLVAIGLERSPAMIISMLAVLKAGGAYLPLDVSYPAERLSYIIADAQAAFVIVNRASPQTISLSGRQPVCLDAAAGAIAACGCENPAQATHPDNLAYVIYTSGSTGKPKGVTIAHRGIGRLVKNIRYARLGPDEVFLQLTSVSFDVSVFEIYGSLLNGGKLALLPAERPSVEQIGKTVSKHQVTAICITPKLLAALLEECPKDLTGLRQVLAGGDVLPAPLAQRTLEQLPQCRLINAYGPTENSVYSTCYCVESVSLDRSIPIGRPIADDCAYILDKELQPVPIGIVGDLYISGQGIARGYLNKPQLTAEKFLPNPFITANEARMYQTGDLACYLPDGNIAFFGRTDNQVKIRGCRVELGEIEAAICQHPAIREAVVIARERSAEKELAAYVVLKANTAFSQHELRSFIREKLPEYMVPGRFAAISRIPLTPAGKVDYRALPEPHGTEKTGTGMLPTTRTQADLARIWERLLNLPTVGVTDNFFDLGGHSLLAMRLFAEIERIFHKKLPVSMIFSEDTIEKLSKAIDGNDTPVMPPSMVAIQTGGAKPPLFCIHAVDGEVFSYRNLAVHLDKDQPVYGIRFVETAIDPAPADIENLAAQYVKSIRRIEPNGPYYLAGHSFGGIVVYEMAQQIYQAGQEVAMLALFDTKNPQYYPILPGKRKSRLEKLANSIKKWRETEDKALYLIEKTVKEWERIHRRLKRLAGIKPIEEILTQAQNTYVPLHYPGRLTVFRAVDSVGTAAPNAQLGWAGFAERGVVVFDVPGDHGSLVQPENIGRLAKQLNGCLAEAQAEYRRKEEAGGAAL